VEFVERHLGLGQVQAHCMPDARRFGKLKVCAFDNLDTVAPWIEEIGEFAVERPRTRLRG